MSALEGRFGKAGDQPDLNQIGATTLTELLYAADPDRQVASGESAARDHYRAIADRIMARRIETGLFSKVEDLAAVEGLSAEAQNVLRERTSLGTFSVVSAENVGPQIGEELRTRGVLAVVLSLLGMMAYIWCRFEFRFGVGAMIASAHDVHRHARPLRAAGLRVQPHHHRRVPHPGRLLGQRHRGHLRPRAREHAQAEAAAAGRR